MTATRPKQSVSTQDPRVGNLAPGAFDKTTSYSDGRQLRDFLKGQLFGTIPELSRNETGTDAAVKSKTIIVTGANSGLGLEASKQFMRYGVVKRLVMACRNSQKGQKARQEVLASAGDRAAIVDVLVWDLDMASRASIRAFTDRALGELDRIDAVVLNAGVDLINYERSKAEDGGYEMTLMVNVVGTMLLTALMIPVLRTKSIHLPDLPRITIVGSAVQFMTKYDVLLEAHRSQQGEGILGWLSDEARWQSKITQDRYFLSKGMVQMVVQRLADIVSAGTVADSQGKSMIVVNCVAPGLCRTDLFRDQQTLGARIMLKTMGRDAHIGARALTIGALGDQGGLDSHGKYMSEGVVKPASSWFATEQGKIIAAQLWEEIADEIEKTKQGAIALL